MHPGPTQLLCLVLYSGGLSAWPPTSRRTPMAYFPESPGKPSRSDKTTHTTNAGGTCASGRAPMRQRMHMIRRAVSSPKAPVQSLPQWHNKSTKLRAPPALTQGASRLQQQRTLKLSDSALVVACKPGDSTPAGIVVAPDLVLDAASIGQLPM